MQRPTVLLVIGDHLHGIGLRTLVQDHPHLRIAGSTAELDQALAVAQALQPDVVLVDSDIDAAAILSFLQALRVASPRSKIILLAAAFDGHTLLACSQIGIEGYLTWRALTSTAVVLHCLTAVVEGGLHVRCPDAVAGLRDAVQAHPAPPTALAALTVKERTVLSGLIAGLSHSDIVDQTHLSLRTVERTVASLKEKLDVPTTPVLVLKAAGLYHPPA